MNDVAQLTPIMTATAHLGSPNSATTTSTSPGGMPPVYNLQSFLQGKDSRWLTLEVCREFTRNRCTRSDQDCRYAHPPPNVEINVGRVTACYDSIKGRCTRTDPPCKYFHPPHHLRDQLLNNGKNALAVKNMIISQLAWNTGSGQVTAVPAIMQSNKAAIHSILQPALSLYDPAALAGASPYLTGAMGTYGLIPGTSLVPLTLGHDAATLASVNMMAASQGVVNAQGNHMLPSPPKAGRQDHRVDGYSGSIQASLQQSANAAAAAAAAASASPYKRVATGDKTGVAMYQAATASHASSQQQQQHAAQQHHHHQQQQQQQHQQHQQQQQHHHQQQQAAAAAAYQQAVASMLSFQQPFVPVTCEYNDYAAVAAANAASSLPTSSSSPAPPCSMASVVSFPPPPSPVVSSASLSSFLAGAPLTAAFLKSPPPMPPLSVTPPHQHNPFAAYLASNHFMMAAAAAAPRMALPPGLAAMYSGAMAPGAQLSPPSPATAANSGATTGTGPVASNASISAAIAAAAAAAAAASASSDNGSPPAKKMRKE